MSDHYTLQVNDSGSWRNVIRGNQEQMEQLEHHVSMIAEIVGKAYKWRIIHAPFQAVCGYCQAPSYIWTQPNKQTGGAA